jgi:hypothetical protein
VRAPLLALLVCVIAAACGNAESPTAGDSQLPRDAVAIVANADIAVGEGRLLVAVAESDGSRLGSPADAVAIEVAPADQPELRQRAEGVFTWIIEDAFGLYRGEFDFDRPGIWNVVVVPAGGGTLQTTFIQVREDSIAPGIGDAAPLVPTPTVATAGLEEITTDPEPDSRFYQLSLDQASQSGAKTVAVFSTPAFCRTATCGPMLDQVKDLAPSYPNLNFVHVEIYAGFNEPDFLPDGDHLAPAVTAGGWNLPSEPWVFVINESGVISHRFEGVMDPAELVTALS